VKATANIKNKKHNKREIRHFVRKRTLSGTRPDSNSKNREKKRCPAQTDCTRHVFRRPLLKNAPKTTEKRLKQPKSAVGEKQGETRENSPPE